MKKAILVALVLMGLGAQAQARSVEEQLIAALKAQGYVILEDGYTFLGRLRIVAESPLYHRELVVNPETGEILRDYATLVAQAAPTAPASHGGGLVTASHGGGSGAGAAQSTGPTTAGPTTAGTTTAGTTTVVTALSASVPVDGAAATAVVPPGGVELGADPTPPVAGDGDANPVVLSDPIAPLTPVAP